MVRLWAAESVVKSGVHWRVSEALLEGWWFAQFTDSLNA